MTFTKNLKNFISNIFGTRHRRFLQKRFLLQLALLERNYVSRTSMQIKNSSVMRQNFEKKKRLNQVSIYIQDTVDFSFSRFCFTFALKYFLQIFLLSIKKKTLPTIDNLFAQFHMRRKKSYRLKKIILITTTSKLVETYCQLIYK